MTMSNIVILNVRSFAEFNSFLSTRFVIMSASNESTHVIPKAKAAGRHKMAHGDSPLRVAVAASPNSAISVAVSNPNPKKKPTKTFYKVYQ